MRHRILHLATCILARLAPRGERDALVGDLMQEHALRAHTASSAAALQWYLQQLCASVPPLLWARLARTAWISTLGVALLAYAAVGVVEFGTNWAISGTAATHAPGYTPLSLIVPFPLVVLIGYSAAGLRRRAPLVLAVMMLLAVTLMTLTAAETMPGWYRIAYFFAGPAAVAIGNAWRVARRFTSAN